VVGGLGAGLGRRRGGAAPRARWLPGSGAFRRTGGVRALFAGRVVAAKSVGGNGSGPR
jgi:hypothetical protein